MSFMYCADGCYYADDPLGSQSPPTNPTPPPPPQNNPNPPDTGGNGGNNGGGNGGSNGGGSTALFNMSVLAGADGSDGLIGLAVNEPGSESGDLIEASVSGDTLEVAAGPGGVLGDGEGHHDPLLSVDASGGPDELQVFVAEEHALAAVQSGDDDLQLEVVSEAEDGVDLIALNEAGIPGGLSAGGDDNGSLVGQLINLGDADGLGIGGLGGVGTGGLDGLGIGSIGGLIGIGGNGSDDSGLTLPGLDTGILQPILAEVDQILSLAA